MKFVCCTFCYVAIECALKYPPAYGIKIIVLIFFMPLTQFVIETLTLGQYCIKMHFFLVNQHIF